MKFKLLFIATCISLVTITSYGQEPQTKEMLASQLLDELQVEKMYDSVFASVSKMQGQMMAAQKVSPEQKAKFQKQMEATMDATKSALDWNSMKAIFAKIYSDNFDEAELNGLIAFYKTPVGQTWIEKQPQIQMATMQAMQQIMPKLQAAIAKGMTQTDNAPAASAAPTP